MAQANLQHQTAYDEFPDGPDAYREATFYETLRRLFQSAVRHAEARIKWYDDKATQLKPYAQSIRWWSLIFFAVGTLIPIAASAITKFADLYGSGESLRDKWNWWNYAAHWPLAEIGYVMLGIAGAVIVFDQFFDRSGSWMRFRQSQARLEVLLADLRYGWAELLAGCGGVIADRATASSFVVLLRQFVGKVEQLAEAETKEWAERFRARIDAFDNNPNLKVRLDSSGTGPAQPQGEAAAATDGGTPINQAQKPLVGGVEGSQAPRPTVTVRLAIEGTDELDPGSLRLMLDETPIPVPMDFLLELPLEVGIAHRLTATASRAGQPVVANAEITPVSEDDCKPLSLNLQ